MKNGTDKRISGERRRALWLAPVLALTLIGCGQADSGESGDRAKTQPAKTNSPTTLPKVPGADGDLAVRAKAMVATQPAEAEPAYKTEPKYPSGHLNGLCYIPTQALAPRPLAPKPQAWDFTGAGAIPKALTGEVEYYRNLRIRKPTGWYIGPRRAAGYGVIGGAAFLRDVKAGPKGPLGRPGFTAQYGQITCQRHGGYGLTNLGFGPVGERVLFGSVDSFPCHFVVTRAAGGKVVFDGVADAYGKLTHPTKRDARRGGRPDPRRFRPKILQSDRIAEPGLYVITCKRHPWQKAYLWVSEHPYVAEIGGGRRARNAGLFALRDIPVGTHTLAVWHPAYEPVHKTIEVQIKHNETTEVLVEFKPPSAAARKRKPPATRPGK